MTPTHAVKHAVRTVDLGGPSIVDAALRNRWPQFVGRIIALAGFVFVIIAGLIGTSIGNHNFAIVFVWIAWWAVLMLIAVPILERGWCSPANTPPFWCPS